MLISSQVFRFTLALVSLLLIFLVALMTTTAASAQGFSAVISPPRFEIAVQPGKVMRQVLEITHVASRPGKYRVYTNDWSIAADGNAVFTDALTADSCRSWVALEKRELTIAANGKIRFRFEISPPADAPVNECRFAIMVEGLEQVIKTEGAVSFPVSGRVGVVVYAAVGGARPKLEISAAGTALQDGTVLPQLEVKNSGNAHGRLGGFLSAVDAMGKQLDFIPEGLPILAQKTRLIPLIPSAQGADPITFSYPLTVKGSLEWGEEKTAVDYRFEAPAKTAAPPPTPPPTPAKAAPIVANPSAK